MRDRRPRLPGERCIGWLALSLLVLHAGVGIADTVSDTRATEVHGHSDTFAASGVAVAWAVARGTTEANTTIVVRVAANPRDYDSIAADGVDPFTQQRKSVLPRRPLVDTIDVRVARAHFADFPRTELRFFGRSGGGAALSALMIYYLGVPDTTPEFATDGQLEIYLATRIAELTAAMKSR